MTGIPRQDVVGCNASRFYASLEWDLFTTPIDAAFRRGHNRYEFFLPREGGGRLPVIISSQALENLGGQFDLMFVTVLFTL
jgi:hypothetical protein